MKNKWINVSETKIAQILGEVNPEVQRKRQNIDGPSLHTLGIPVINYGNFQNV